MKRPDIVSKVFENWVGAIKDKVKGNYSMENSTITSKFPYATLYFMGITTGDSSLEKAETAFSPSLQVDIYTTGQKALSEAYEIDELSHVSLLNMFFRRTYGPELIQSTDPSIKRLVSRYSRTIGDEEKL